MRHCLPRIAAVGVLGCSAAPVGEPQPPPAEDRSPLAGPPSNRKTGELLEESVPLLAGGALELASLRGQAVILELSATWADHYAAAHELYRDLVGRHGSESIAVVSVALDGDRGPLHDYWNRNPLGFTLGWDPQGALAARLQAGDLPTIFVLDRQGKIVHVQGGFDPGNAEALTRAVAASVEGSGMRGGDGGSS